MEPHPLVVEMYETEAGVVPLKEWMSRQDIKTRTRIDARIAKLRLGLYGKNTDKVGDNIIELKEHHGSGYRIYCREVGGQIVVLLCGGDKSSQSRDIQKAKEYWKNYQERNRQ